MPTEQEILVNLRDFYNAWIAWVKGGAPRVPPFSRDNGLCQSLANYAYQQELGVAMANKMKDYMKLDFLSEGYDAIYPFGEEDWDRRYQNDTMHLCPRRYAFCVKMTQRVI